MRVAAASGVILPAVKYSLAPKNETSIRERDEREKGMTLESGIDETNDSLDLATGGTLVAVSLYALGRVRPPTPVLEVWMSGRAPAWYSPPLLDRIRDSSGATVLTEPLACDAGGQYGGPRNGDSAAAVDRPTPTAT